VLRFSIKPCEIVNVQKETKETFRESLLNTCQESFQERDRILRSAGESSQRWVAFINFLNEMYLQVNNNDSFSESNFLLTSRKKLIQCQ
jgi:hypothetical protein